jgi:hypothetical protein
MKKLIFLLLLTILAGCNSLQISAQSNVYEPQSLFSAKAIDPALVETRYCGAPKRDAKGNIIRSAKVTAAFRADNVCPDTNMTTGRCDNWQIDHVKPLHNGGCDTVSNMQWLPVWLKTCAGYCKDRWELKINCRPVAEGGTGCVNSIISPPP